MPYKTYQQNSRRSGRNATPSSEEKEATAPIIEEVVKPEDVDMADVTAENDGKQENGDSEKKKLWFQKIKESGIKKTPKDVLKKKRNFRLKKMLTPKPPLMILHELLPQANLNYEFEEPSVGQMARNTPPMYTARVSHSGEKFEGKGPSKSIAKNMCAEKVLQHIVTKSCLADTETETGETGEEKENEESPEKEGKQQRMETETPWVSLASLALFKMFNDWQSQGYDIPVDMGRTGSGGEKAVSEDTKDSPEVKDKQSPKKAVPVIDDTSLNKSPAKVEKALPENPTVKHPVQLLNEMEGPLTYVEASPGGGEAGVFSLSVSVRSRDFSGQGKTKKEAKKQAAANALKAIHGVNYDD